MMILKLIIILILFWNCGVNGQPCLYTGPTDGSISLGVNWACGSTDGADLYINQSISVTTGVSYLASNSITFGYPNTYTVIANIKLTRFSTNKMTINYPSVVNITTPLLCQINTNLNLYGTLSIQAPLNLIPISNTYFYPQSQLLIKNTFAKFDGALYLNGTTNNLDSSVAIYGDPLSIFQATNLVSTITSSTMSTRSSKVECSGCSYKIADSTFAYINSVQYDSGSVITMSGSQFISPSSTFLQSHLVATNSTFSSTFNTSMFDQYLDTPPTLMNLQFNNSAASLTTSQITIQNGSMLLTTGSIITIINSPIFSMTTSPITIQSNSSLQFINIQQFLLNHDNNNNDTLSTTLPSTLNINDGSSLNVNGGNIKLEYPIIGKSSSSVVFTNVSGSLESLTMDSSCLLNMVHSTCAALGQITIGKLNLQSCNFTSFSHLSLINLEATANTTIFDFGISSINNINLDSSSYHLQSGDLVLSNSNVSLSNSIISLNSSSITFDHTTINVSPSSSNLIQLLVSNNSSLSISNSNFNSNVHIENDGKLDIYSNSSLNITYGVDAEIILHNNITLTSILPSIVSFRYGSVSGNGTFNNSLNIDSGSIGSHKSIDYLLFNSPVYSNLNSTIYITIDNITTHSFLNFTSYVKVDGKFLVYINKELFGKGGSFKVVQFNQSINGNLQGGESGQSNFTNLEFSKVVIYDGVTGEESTDIPSSCGVVSKITNDYVQISFNSCDLNSGLSKGAIAGIVVGSVVFVVGGAATAYFARQRHLSVRDKKYKSRFTGTAKSTVKPN